MSFKIVDDSKTYLVDDGELTLLANFAAEIKHELRLVDEQTTEIFVTVTGKMYNVEDSSKPIQLPDVQLSADEFVSMGWLMNKWGVRVVLKAGSGSKEHMRVCIQTRSNPTIEYIYKHTGWAKLPNGKQGYIHSGGAITRDGNDTSIKSQLPNDLRNYNLAGKHEPKASVKATLGLLELGPKGIIWPSIASLFVPIIGPADFAIHLAGRSGTYKSELASLLQSHYGAKMDARALPGSWGSTPGALESLAYFAKNAMFVIDDFVPTGNSNQQKSYHQSAEKLIRAVGNQAGRQRLTDMSKMQSTMYPRSMIYSTGEEIYDGMSIRGRSYIMEISPGEIEPAKLSKAQANRQLFPGTIAGFIQAYAKEPVDVKAEIDELRNSLAGIGHSRTPTTMARLIVAARLFLAFARSIGAITDAEHKKLLAESHAAIVAGGENQKTFLEGADPTELFVQSIRQAMEAKQAHIRSMNDGTPHEAEALGWHRLDGGDEGMDRFKSAGPTIGWINPRKGEIYLSDTVSYSVVKKMNPSDMNLSRTTLIKRLKEAGILSRTEESRSRNTIRVRCGGTYRQVLCMPMETFVTVENPDADSTAEDNEDE